MILAFPRLGLGNAASYARQDTIQMTVASSKPFRPVPVLGREGGRVKSPRNRSSRPRPGIVGTAATTDSATHPPTSGRPVPRPLKRPPHGAAARGPSGNAAPEQGPVSPPAPTGTGRAFSHPRERGTARSSPSASPTWPRSGVSPSRSASAAEPARSAAGPLPKRPGPSYSNSTGAGRFAGRPPPGPRQHDGASPGRSGAPYCTNEHVSVAALRDTPSSSYSPRGSSSNSAAATADANKNSSSIGSDNSSNRISIAVSSSNSSGYSTAPRLIASAPSFRAGPVLSTSASASAGQRGTPPQELGYSQRIARLRKPSLTAADKLDLEPEERARIFRELRTPRHQGWVASPRAAPPEFRDPEAGPAPPRASLPLRVFCYGIDDVRLYRALEQADALGQVVVAPDVASADAVWATRIKRTGRALSLSEISNAARNAGKPFLELPAVSAVRVMEAVEALTGVRVPEHLRTRPPRMLEFLPPLDADPGGSGRALRLLTGGLSLPDYLLGRSGPDLPPHLLSELDRADLYDSREGRQPVNPQEREAARQRPLFRPYMDGSRVARQRLMREHLQLRAEAEGAVTW